MASGISLNGALSYPSLIASKVSTAAAAIPGIGVTAGLLQGAAGAGNGQSSVTEADTAKPKSAADEFKEYMQMSDEDKLKYALLAQMGVSKEQYDAMSPEDKAKIDKKLGDRMEQIAQAQNQSGAAAQGVAAKLQTFVNSAQAGEKKTPLLNFKV